MMNVLFQKLIHSDQVANLYKLEVASQAIKLQFVFELAKSLPRLIEPAGCFKKKVNPVLSNQTMFVAGFQLGLKTQPIKMMCHSELRCVSRGRSIILKIFYIGGSL